MAGWQKHLYLHHQGEFQPNYYTFVSLNDNDHDSAVRIFVALSSKLWGYLFTLFTLRGTIFSLPGV